MILLKEQPRTTVERVWCHKGGKPSQEDGFGAQVGLQFERLLKKRTASYRVASVETMRTVQWRETYGIFAEGDVEMTAPHDENQRCDPVRTL